MNLYLNWLRTEVDKNTRRNNTIRENKHISVLCMWKIKFLNINNINILINKINKSFIYKIFINSKLNKKINKNNNKIKIIKSKLK